MNSRDRIPIMLVGVVLLVDPSGVIRGGSPVRADSIALGSPPQEQGDDEAAGLDLPRGNEDLREAREQFRSGRFDQALAALERAVEADPSLPPPRAMLAMMFLSADQVEQGRMLLEQAAAESPDQPYIYMLFGRIALAQNRVTDALLAFEKAGALTPPESWDESLRKQFQLSIEEGLATVAEGRGHWEQARSRLESCLELKPENGRLRQRLGRALFHLGEVEAAHEALKAAVADDPSLEPAAVSIGRLYAAQGDPTNAESWLDHAVKSAPDDPKTRLARASWLLEQNRPDEAQDDAKAVERIQPDSPELTHLKGQIAFARGDYTEAERHFQDLHIKSPGNFDIGNRLALALAEQDDPVKQRRALELARVNARQYPNVSAALVTLGWALFRNGQVEQAEQTIRAAAGRGQINSDAAFRIARILHARGQTEEAIRLVERALQAPGTFIQREEARQWLNQHARPE